MPLVAFHLIALSPNATISRYLRALSSHSIKPLVASKVIRWIIRPEKLSTHLVHQKWDMLLILPASTAIPNTYLSKDWVYQHWSIFAGVPKSLIDGFGPRNQQLLHPRRVDVPELTTSLGPPKLASSSQALELDAELLAWSKDFQLGQTGAVSMLNLLSFHPGREAHESYLRYGKAFSQSIGAKRGGNAKIVGRVVPNQGTPNEDQSGWDEIALAHYPSFPHFVAMLASEDYQEVNHECRLPALADTCILCTTELDPELSTDKARL